jgi:hypothetical protein
MPLESARGVQFGNRCIVAFTTYPANEYHNNVTFYTD